MYDDIMNKMPLVSVAIASYNSSKTIVATLDSVYNQSYSQIELIISDDCSQDNTIDVCRNWLKSHSERFVSTELLIADKNGGICVNGNKSRRHCNGEWQMGLAADDILLPNCIFDNVEYILNHPEASFVFSRMRVYQNEFAEENHLNIMKGPNNLSIFLDSPKKQLIHMAYSAFVYAPTMFNKKDAFFKVGGYDNKYGYEDWPFFIRILEYGYKCHYIDKETVGYRIHNSLSHSEGKLFNYSLTKKTIPFLKEKCFKYYSLRKKVSVRLMWFIEWLLYTLHLDSNTSPLAFIYKKTATALYLIGNSSLNKYRLSNE